MEFLLLMIAICTAVVAPLNGFIGGSREKESVVQEFTYIHETWPPAHRPDDPRLLVKDAIHEIDKRDSNRQLPLVAADDGNGGIRILLEVRHATTRWQRTGAVLKENRQARRYYHEAYPLTFHFSEEDAVIIERVARNYLYAHPRAFRGRVGQTPGVALYGESGILGALFPSPAKMHKNIRLALSQHAWVKSDAKLHSDFAEASCRANMAERDSTYYSRAQEAQRILDDLKSTPKSGE